ncbi:type 4a pilus biogenesis protein PilO [Marinobacterium sediminicola]|uniref:Type IV pilus assembly protein PilO n=1 Tax=Marinobacterium sediminicola TaxID=518898 RepID=A0ABY1S1W5_9GAMM|nr:type 4a pilus biogenesis protein PilO [Marinobacterium sediminicola]ULG69524.1 type 4a pilus biogenesis protein PilO [Marinobacterium sediminicola]SMR75676.1 type IV pilus assembly protein PilO [Marinobacterium sediminicola]
MDANSFKRAFQGFDVNNVDINQAGNWPIGVKVVVYLLVFAVVVGAGVHFFIKDKHVAVEREISKEREHKQEYQTKAFQVASLDALRKQMADVEGRFAELLKQLPTDKEVPGLLEDITEIGQAAGLEFTLIQLEPERKEQFYVELPIRIMVQGNYHQMGEFVSGVAAIKRIVTLHDFSLSPEAGGRLSMEISAKTYRYDDTK